MLTPVRPQNAFLRELQLLHPHGAQARARVRGVLNMHSNRVNQLECVDAWVAITYAITSMTTMRSRGEVEEVGRT